MLLSLITGTYNRPLSVKRLLASIQKFTTVQWELIVSDASEATYTLDVPFNVRVVEEHPRLGCVKGYNRAFRLATGAYCLWLNDDCEVLAGYDVAAIEFMERNPRIGLGALHYSEEGGPFHVNSAWGAAYANFGIIPRALGDQVGWFDEDLTMYGCDNSLTFRVLLAGKGVSDIPAAKILHHSEKDSARIENQMTRRLDNDILHRKYFPLRHQWLETYNRYKIHSETAWPHGRAPVSTRP